MTMHNDARTRQHDTDRDAAPPELPPELVPIAAAIDRLAGRDRAEPDDAFERRISRATRPGVAGAIDAKGPAHAWRWALPIAACLTLTVGALWAVRAGSPPSRAGSPAIELAAVSIETEIEDLLFIDDLQDEIESAELSAGSLGLDDESAGDLFLDAFAGGTEQAGGSS